MGKFRHEYKYLCTEAQLAILEVRLKGLMARDRHAGPEGRYRIRSLYFDDMDDRCYYENEHGVSPREKYRIRIYNNSPDQIRLECKRKERDRVSKTSVPLTRNQFEYLAYGKGEAGELPWLAGRLEVLRKTSGMKPKVIVSYERTPYVYGPGNVRVTFDRAIASSSQAERFFEEKIGQRPVLPVGVQLLEVKYDEFLPDHIYQALSLQNLARTTFSKYYLCRRYDLV